jgi:hypothetical protein
MPGGEADALAGDHLKKGDILLRFNLSLVGAAGSSDETVIASGTERYGIRTTSQKSPAPHL